LPCPGAAGALQSRARKLQRVGHPFARWPQAGLVRPGGGHRVQRL